ncbi:CBX8 protein, partial [Amia calva]|nr:CBX8 protein [Amia calva]
QAKAKAKAKTYEFRSDASRGMRVSYPGPESIITPRAREGLRTIVPTIFPPSTVNRGESVRIPPPEPVREHRPPGPERHGPDGLVSVPKKRGPKPKCRFKTNPTSLPAPEPSKRSRLEEQVGYAMAKYGPLESDKTASGLSVIQLARRKEVEPGYVQNQGRPVPTGSSHGYGPGSSAHLSRAGFQSSACRTKECPGGTASSYPRLKHLSKNHVYQSDSTDLCSPPSLVAKIPVSRILGEPEEDYWSPSLSNVEKVVVTDVTTNFLTVTIKESNTDQGFFKDKR